MGKLVPGNNAFYAKNAVSDLGENTTLLSHRGSFSKNISLVNKPLNSWQVSTVNPPKLLKGVLIVIG